MYAALTIMSTTRRLWLQPGETVSPSQATETHAEILDRCAIRPAPVLLWDRISNSLVVGQEFILTCLFLAGHRIIKLENSEAAIDILQPSLLLVWTSFVLVIRHNQPTDLVDATQARSVKIRHRTADGIFMAILLRFLAAVLKTLTASYSTDTVYALAISGFVLHLLACDYSYANGVRRSHTQQARDATQRPAFQGGTLSLTAAFFATILLASRLESNVIVYIFVSSSVVLFALYPAARHQVAINTQSKNKWGEW